ncbi:MAG: NADH:ubiquinone reductase (Na(+)-transporting) subunit C [Bacteroidales bacterium]|nr:NADH:ubiquinone reductase (Na(+)-transporting) subunit C [Bacteroidales bacterium]MDE5810353.1 NADH:ubiquinone reductase (Na(+)-transporting) subunit C [Muribaculaceae bacterium]
MNKQSNIYTIIYIIVLVVVVGAALAFTAMSLKDRQQANADNDKRRQILSSVNITANPAELTQEFDKYITGQVVVNAQGDSIGSDAFSINMVQQVKVAADERQLPLYICSIDGSTKYIIPLYGQGLWGPIWGYISLNDDASTVYGAFFDHQGETPGLGAEITKDAFRSEFRDKELFKGDKFLPIAVVKAGMTPNGGEDYVNGISGGTITSKGVGAMLDECLKPYRNYLEKLRTNK